jgi:type II secretory pathway predicted ATPase ExeA
MLAEVQEHFGFARDPQAAGFYETPYHRQFLRDLRSAIHVGKLIAFTGLVGSGKTLLLRQLQAHLVAEKRVTVSKSLAVDKDRASLTTLITALFYDLSPEKDPRIPTQSEHRERALRDLVRKSKRPVVLFVDEAHDLHHKTLSGLKRLREVVADGDGVRSIVLAGHPRLRNALMRPNMEEVGFRFAVFPFEGMAGHQASYIVWLLGRCLRDGADPTSVIEPDAVDLLAARLRTPLQVERYLEMAFEETHRIGERVVTLAVVDAVLSRQLDELEPRLTRHGYDVRSIADEFRVKPADVRLFLQGQLDPARTRELTEQMLVAGLPV